MRAQPPKGARPPPPGDFQAFNVPIGGLIALQHCAASIGAQFNRGRCNSDEQKRRCTYCSHVLI
jgi:hypothetical protein